MPTHVRLAQISDIHLGFGPLANGIVLADAAGDLLDATVRALNDEQDLDAVLVTGDLVDGGDSAELAAVTGRLAHLRAPWFAIPGNHDTAFLPDPSKLDRGRFYEQLAAAGMPGADYAGARERGSWTARLGPTVLLIGLDSNIPGDWAGSVDPAQLAWLDAALAEATESLVVLAVHHPLHAVFGGWKRPHFAGQDWHKFFCRNGAEVNAILDRYSHVRCVLTGHDHLSRVDQIAGRLHLSAPALGSYPLAYRLLDIDEARGGWTVRWQTRSAAPAALTARARTLLESSDLAANYDPENYRHFVEVSVGRPEDQHGSAVLGEGRVRGGQ